MNGHDSAFGMVRAFVPQGARVLHAGLIGKKLASASTGTGANRFETFDSRRREVPCIREKEKKLPSEQI